VVALRQANIIKLKRRWLGEWAALEFQTQGSSECEVEGIGAGIECGLVVEKGSPPESYDTCRSLPSDYEC
jgi:hypothetical protein